jgi:hypothetical protein
VGDGACLGRAWGVGVLETADRQRGWVGAGTKGVQGCCVGELRSFLTMAAWFPKWAACVLPPGLLQLESDMRSFPCCRKVVRQPVSALHSPVHLPVETRGRSLSSSSEEFVFVWTCTSQHQEIWRTGPGRRQDETSFRPRRHRSEPIAAAVATQHSPAHTPLARSG